MSSVLYKEQVQTLLEKVSDRINYFHNGHVDGYYSFTIDHSKSDPATMITVLDNTLPAANSTDWFTLLGIKPCVLKNGSVLYYLNPDDFTKTEAGGTADLTTLGNDVMIEIPKMGIKGEWLTSDVMKVTLTTNSDVDGFDYSAFSNKAWNDSSKMYVGVYKCYCTGNMMYSSKGRTPTASQTLATYRTWAGNRGSGYYDITYAADEILQALYCLIVQNLNSQSAIGNGNISASAAIATGGSEAYGMLMQNASSDIKTATSGYHSKCLGIEDLWGNIWQWEDGIIKEAMDSSGYITIKRAPYASLMNSDGTNYKTVGSIYIGAAVSGYTTRMNGLTGGIFIGVKAGGSTTTYYSDYMDHTITKSISDVGGSWYSGADAGVFRRSLYDAPSTTRAIVASRLLYLA